MLRPLFAVTCMLFVALLSGCATAPEAGQEQTVTASKVLKSIPVTVSYEGGVLYRVQLNNNLPSPITLLWDESSYITTAGQTIRLLHLPDKSELPRQAPAQQTPSRIPAHSQFEAGFTADEWLDCARRNCTPHAKDSLKNARIFLAFNVKGKRITWQGEVVFAPPKQH